MKHQGKGIVNYSNIIPEINSGIFKQCRVNCASKKAVAKAVDSFK